MRRRARACAVRAGRGARHITADSAAARMSKAGGKRRREGPGGRESGAPGGGRRGRAPGAPSERAAAEGRTIGAGDKGRRGEHPAPINLTLTIRNFGPLEHGSIDIRPLTILIGPNNSGKSYVAMLLRSIVAAQSRVAAPRLRVGGATAACRDMLRKKYEKGVHKMAITRPESRKIMGALLDEEMGPALERQIAGDFGSGVRDLVRAGKSSAGIEVSETDPASGKTHKLAIRMGDKLSVKSTAEPASYLVEAKPGSRYYHISASDRRGDQSGTGGDAMGSRGAEEEARGRGTAGGSDPDRLCTSCAVEVAGMISSRLRFRTIPDNTYYFPAARSGILQGHKAMAAGMVAHAPYGGTRAAGMPLMTGIAADFISRMMLPEKATGPFAATASDMEEELLGGNITMDATAEGEGPEITYRYNGSAVPLHRSSSAISEIAPLSLCLKHIVDKGAFLIIEEPEAHLHPASQLVLAKYIVRLIRGGANILMSTHSVFLLEKLAKYMMAGSLAPKQRSTDLGYGRGDFLTQGEVSAYIFERQPGGGHRTKPVDMDEEYGISQEEFVRVSESLHRETIIINSKMGTLGNA